MREDIRLLGAILGDTVREQSGDAVFELVERARVEAFRVRRSEIDRAELARLFAASTSTTAIPVIRAFTHFALLANVAEDIHRERRRAVHVAAGEPPQNSSLAATYLKLESAELDSETVADALTGALVSPVITAHPTETRRRTVFDTQHRITELMRQRMHGQTRTDDGRSIDPELRRNVLVLWQTALIRLSRLKIQDEIETGLRYYPAALFEVIPQVNAEVRTALQARWPDAHVLEQPILRPGSWIGGDRDGNPNVTAEVVRLATGSAAYTALAHYFARAERARAGAVDVGAAGDGQRRRWRSSRRCAEPARADEPYRRALRDPRPPDRDGAAILDRQREPASTSAAGATRRRRELLADLDVVDASLRDNGSAVVADDRLAGCGKPCTSSASTSPGWTCARTPRCTRRSSPRCWHRRGVHPDYGSLDEADRVEVLIAELRHPPAARRAGRRTVGDRRARSSRIVHAAARAVQVFGPRRCRTTSSRCASRCRDMLEAAILLQGGRPARRVGRHPTARWGSCRCSRPSTTCSAARRFSKRARPAALPRPGRTRAASSGGHARLLGQQQGRRLPRRELGAVPGRARPGRVGPQAGIRFSSSTAAAAPSAAAAALATTPILAQPPGSVKASLRITEQGEVIAAKYANPASRTATSRRWSRPPWSDPAGRRGLGDAARPAYEVLDELAARAQQAYSELVHETPGFVEYFKASTPVSEIGALNIGSRPTSRKPTTAIADLRAIPWVLAWSQSRVMLPGWYGTGTAFEQWVAEGDGRLEELQDLYVRWPFFPRCSPTWRRCGQGGHGAGGALLRTGRGRGVAAPGIRQDRRRA